jgi:hypothetical protein
MMAMGTNEPDTAPGADVEPCVQGRAAARTGSCRRTHKVVSPRWLARIWMPASIPGSDLGGCRFLAAPGRAPEAAHRLAEASMAGTSSLPPSTTRRDTDVACCWRARRADLARLTVSSAPATSGSSSTALSSGHIQLRGR